MLTEKGAPQFDIDDDRDFNLIGNLPRLLKVNAALRDYRKIRTCAECKEGRWDPEVPSDKVDCNRTGMIEDDNHYCGGFKHREPYSGN